jgi:tetratricopeptide (TPR) repeat protein
MHRFRVIVGLGLVAAVAGAAIWLARLQGSDGGRTSPSRVSSRDGGADDPARSSTGAADRHAPQAAAEAAAHARRKAATLEQAAKLESALPGGDGLSAAGQALLRFGMADEAEARFQRALRLGPAPGAQEALCDLFLIEGRHWEARPHLLAQLRLSPSVGLLRRLAHPGRFVGPEAELARFRQVAPEDAGPAVGLALLRLREGKPEQARTLLEEVIRGDGDFLEAHALLGWTLTQLPEGDGAIPAWQAGLPEGAREHPLVWLSLGMWCKARQQPREAARCLWEAVRRDPNNAIANFQLAQVLSASDAPRDALPFQQRADRLLSLERTIETFSDVSPRLDSVRLAAELTEALGRPREAWGWQSVLASLTPDDPAPRLARARLEALLTGDASPAVDKANPANLIDLSDYPLPRWDAGGLANATQTPAITESDAIRFDDQASAAGIEFVYRNGADPSTPGARMFETTGGGVAAWDFDQDGWPDIYLTQGGDWPVEEGQRVHLDRLFRNLGTGRFMDVTALSGLGDERFSQGVSAGDYDNDGFPDLYVANIGGNRLYRNLGDGTFLDVSEVAGVSGDSWTTSCLLADVNGDSIPDLYDVNYLEGDDVYERICSAQGRPAGACSPRAFQGQPDQLWLGLGDGRFVDHSASIDAALSPGNGLGIVAGMFDESRRLSLFIANDQTPNFLLVNEAPDGDPPLFGDEGLSRGVAVDREGRAQGCMGVAADDLDGDGLLDLFVTNFMGEANALYRAELQGRTFTDISTNTGLAAPSFLMVGFGAQSIDADLDGWPDLIVTNGHVDDFDEEKSPYQMRPQFFRNLAGKRFVELPAESLGPFFDGEYLGRGLARLDWNRDGREDAVISHMNSPAALLTNQTRGAGSFLSLRLRAVDSARDAIGTIVRARVGDRLLTRQLTAGDGYQASNQRQLVFGLGSADRVDQLTVLWPSGLEQTFADLSGGREWVLIEGDATPHAVVGAGR